jgi:hypothetical protein
MSISKVLLNVIVAVISCVGTISAAWITAGRGLVSFPNPALQRKVDELTAALDNRSQLTGDYEWQWAGDNWLGSIKFQKLSNGSMSSAIDLRVVKPDPRNGNNYQVIKALESDVEGTASVGQQSVISLHLPVLVTPEYRKIHHVSSAHIDIDAELQPVEAFAGRARYVGDETTSGDIILVRYRSEARKW